MKRLSTWSSCIVLAAAFSWWQTGVHPFTAIAYVSLLPPVALALVLAARGPGRLASNGRPRVRLASFAQFLPLLGVVTLGIGLEIAGLALGGRDAAMPTVSTVLDRAMCWHATRWLMLMAWLAILLVPLVVEQLRRSTRVG